MEKVSLEEVTISYASIRDAFDKTEVNLDFSVTDPNKMNQAIKDTTRIHSFEYTRASALPKGISKIYGINELDVTIGS